MPDKRPQKSLTEALSDISARAAQPKEILTTKEASTYLNVSTAFLERDRWDGKRTGSGPLIRYVTMGNRAIRYRLSDLRDHIDQNLTG